MDIGEFQETLKLETPPSDLTPPLLAMWHDAKGDWEQAHELAQDILSTVGYHIHAYLHRKEGDVGNAKYWYSSAKQAFPSVTLEDEWLQIVELLLQSNS